MADVCVDWCYAKKGAYTWSNVQPAFEKRYELSKTDQFVSKMYDEIVKKKRLRKGSRQWRLLL